MGIYGRLRHLDACEAFKDARPKKPRWATRGESYDVELYESIIPAILEHVATGADLLPEVMRELDHAEEPDQDTLGRIQREREAAGRKVAFDRDMRSSPRCPRRTRPTPDAGSVHVADTVPRHGGASRRHFVLMSLLWSGREDLNLRPHRPERCALPSCATPRPKCPYRACE